MSKTISFGEFDAHANGYLSQLVDDLLREKGIEPASFGYSIEVDYTEVEDDEALKDIFGSDTIDPELWDELDEMDEGQRINVPMCVLDLKRIRQFIKENEDE